MIHEKSVQTTQYTFVCDLCGHPGRPRNGRSGKMMAQTDQMMHDCTRHAVRHDGDNWLRTNAWWVCTCGERITTDIMAEKPTCPNAPTEETS